MMNSLKVSTLERWQQSRFVTGYSFLMLVLCVLYAFSVIPNFEWQDDLKNAIIFGSLPYLITLIAQKRLDKAPLILIFFAIILQVVSWGYAHSLIPNELKSYPQIKPLVSLFIFVFISLWVAPKRLYRLLLLAGFMGGFLYAVIHHQLDHNTLIKGLQGRRVDFDMHNAQFTSMLGIVIIFVTAFISHALYRCNKLSAGVLLLVMTPLGLFITFISQSRQVWLALVITLAFLPLIIFKKNGKAMLVLYTALAIAGYSVLSNDTVQRRINSESNTVQAITQMQWDKIPMSSIGIRVNSWIESLDWIARSPIVGQSKEAIPLVIQQSDVFPKHLKRFGHLHNYYLETLVAYGALGILFIIAFYRWIYLNIKEHGSRFERYFFITFLLFWAIINCFESYNNKHLGLFAHTIILASLYYPFRTIKTSSVDENEVISNENMSR
ncbi:O-antigen ligase family protein [Vibrio sp.]|nr:O-antigen ligase family protein [Vibrio sp.]